MSSTITKIPMSQRTKRSSRSNCCARSMKNETILSHRARAITAICFFLIRIPAVYKISSFLNLCCCLLTPNTSGGKGRFFNMWTVRKDCGNKRPVRWECNTKNMVICGIWAVRGKGVNSRCSSEKDSGTESGEIQEYERIHQVKFIHNYFLLYNY